jgi:hypothetical protein
MSVMEHGRRRRDSRFPDAKPIDGWRSAGTMRTTTALRIGINQLGTAFNGLAARGQNPTLSSQSLRRQEGS